MQLSKALFCLFPAICSLPAVQAQEVKKRYNELALWPTAEVRHIISPREFAYVNSQWRYSTDSSRPRIRGAQPFSAFEDIRLTLGYENELTEQWRAGLAQRVAFEEDILKWYSRFNLRHRGQIKSLYFVKRVLYEHIRNYDRFERSRKLEADNRVRFNFSLERPFKVSGKQFSTALEYEILFELDPEAAKQENKPRRIDRTRLQGELSYFPSGRMTFTLFAIKQTRYDNFLEQTDDQGNVVGGGKTNRITPIVGLEVQVNTNLDEIDPLRNRR